jgi:hypothetical protein
MYDNESTTSPGQLANLNRLLQFIRVINIPFMIAILGVLVYFPLSDQLDVTDIHVIWNAYLDQLNDFFAGGSVDSDPIYAIFTLAVVVDIIGLWWILGWIMDRNRQKIEKLQSAQLEDTESHIHPS